MKNTKISIPASIHLSGQPFIGIYNAKKTLPLKSKSGCDDCRLDERFNEIKNEIASLSDVYDPKGAAAAYETLIEHKIGEAVLATIRSSNQYAYDLVGLSAGALCSDLSGLSNIVINETVKIETKINEIISALSSLSDQIDIDILPIIDPTDPSEEEVDPVTPPPVFSITELIYYLTTFRPDYIDEHDPLRTSEMFMHGLFSNALFNDKLYNQILNTIANNYAEISSGAYVSAVYASKEELSSVRDELIERIDSCQDVEALDRISALEEANAELRNEIEKLKKEQISSILDSWDPFALSDITDTRESIPHTRDYLSGFLVDMDSDFTMADMESSFYGMKSMAGSCYFGPKGINVPDIPYDEAVAATYEVNAFKYHYVGPVTAGPDYYWLSGSWRKFTDGDIVEFNIDKNTEDWISHGSSSGTDKFFIQESENWTYLSSHIVEEKESVGPSFNHLRKTYNAIVEGFLEADKNFEFLFSEKNVHVLTQEESTMDILQGAMNNLIYALLGTYNSHTDILYQGTLREFVSDENYTLDSVAAALKSVITILQNK